MPCHDPRDEMDRIRAEKDREALIALLCGVCAGIEADPNQTWAQDQATEIALNWYKAHKKIDEIGVEHKNRYGTSEYEEIKRFQGYCDAALDRAHQVLVHG